MQNTAKDFHNKNRTKSYGFSQKWTLITKLVTQKLYYMNMNSHQPVDEDSLIDSQYLPTAGGVTD